MRNDKTHTADTHSLGKTVWTLFARRFMPVVLLVAGSTTIIYGAFYHVISVNETVKEETSIPAPNQFDNGPGPDMSNMGGENAPPVPLAPPQTIKVYKTATIAHEKNESNIVMDITVGGVALEEDGKIVQTYTGTKGPSYCPT